jgi:subtilisin-like proprotein convertase family protein
MRPEAPAVQSPSARARRPAARPRPARPAARRRAALEALEPRTLLAVLPTPTVAAPVAVSASRGNENTPAIAVDPTNPQKLVATWTRNDPQLTGDTKIIAEAAYSTNAGASWTGLNLAGALSDPTTTNPVRAFAQITDTSVAFDRNGVVYILESQHSGDNGTGALVLQKFDFAGPTPTALPFSATGDPIQQQLGPSSTRRVIYEWIQDPAFAPMLAVDNNLPSFTDATPGGQTVTQVDPYAGTVYVAWATRDVAPANNPTNFNPNTIKIVASADGGQSFTAHQILNDGGHFGADRDTAPRLAVSQGTIDGRVPGGQVTVVWDDFNSANTANPARDVITTDRIRDGGAAAVFSDLVGGPIADASNANPNVAATTPFVLPVTLGAARQFTDLDVTVNLDHPALGDLTLTLVPPSGATGANGLPLAPIELINRQAAGANLGTTASGVRLGTVFDDQAARNVVDFNGTTRGAAAPFTGHFQSQGRDLAAIFGSIFGTPGAVSGAQLSGTWTLRITDAANGNVGTLRNWALTFTEGLTDGADSTVPTFDFATFAETAIVRGNLNGPYPTGSAAVPERGIGPAPTIAADNTLGALSPYQGRLYVAYVGRYNLTGNQADNTEVFLAASDDGGLSWNALAGGGFGSPILKVNDDDATVDGFSEASPISGRPQFQPQLAVDQSTGTLVAAFLDARHDAARARVVTTLTASIDGGQSFSSQRLDNDTPTTQPFANALQTARDQATQRTIALGPIPENQSTGNGSRDTTFNFGDRQGLAVAAGQIHAAWAGNQNGGLNGAATEQVLLNIRTSTAQIATGPRIVASTMGPVGGPGDALNGTRAADGTPQARAFTVTFDRPVDPSTFGVDDARVVFRDTTAANATGGPVPVTGVAPLDLGPFGPAGARLATQFRVDFTPSGRVGTYSYVVGPDIRDGIRGLSFAVINPQTTTFTAPAGQVNLRVPPVGTGGTGVPAQDVTTSSLAVSGLPPTDVIADADVSLRLTHTFVGDLILTLIAPDGTRIPLAVRRGGSGDNFGVNPANPGAPTATTFDDQAAIAIGDVFNAAPPYIGSFRPDAPLAQLNGKGANGTWTLEINDAAGADVGALLAWSLRLQTGIRQAVATPGNRMDQDADGQPGEAGQDAYGAPRPLGGVGAAGAPLQFPFDPETLPLIVPGPRVVATRAVLTDVAPVTPTNGENLVLGGTVSAVDVTFDRDMRAGTFGPEDVTRVMGPAGLVAGPFSVTPLSARTFRVSFPTQRLSGTYTVTLGPGLLSAAGDALDQNQNAGVDLLRGVASTNATTPVTVGLANLQLPIPDAANVTAPGRVTSTIAVTDNFQVQGVTLTLNITHPSDPDLQATLIAPDGTRIRLFANVGSTGNQANFTNTTFSDAAASSIANGGPPFNGQFRTQPDPNDPVTLSALVGRLSAGVYTLELRDTGPNGLTGQLNGWSLSFLKPVPASGLGEPGADVATASFRIFTMDPANPLSSTTWTSVGPAAIGVNGRSGRVGGLAIDPADPSGNTVFVGGASGGVWKTTNFLTTDARGPTYVPLTDFGPTFALNIGSIAVFNRPGGNPNQSIVFAATGEGDVGSTGVGILRSLDGGATWTLLDSTVNFDPNGNLLPIASPGRDHVFVGSTAFKIVVDPNATVTGDVIVYVALSGRNGGIWRSDDSGRTWGLLNPATGARTANRPGQATDVVLDPTSGTPSPTNPTGNLQVVYGAFRGDGVYLSPNQGQVWNLMGGGVGNPLIQDADVNPPRPVPVNNLAVSPNGPKGRIVLAKPELVPSSQPNAPVQNLIYQGWLYAAVVTPNDHLDGVYLTKDNGQNWTRLRIPTLPPIQAGGGTVVLAVPTNDTARADYDVLGNAVFAQGNYDVSLVVDPNNPNVIYLGGTADGNPSGLIRIDATLASDAHAFYLANDRDDGGQLLVNVTDAVDLKAGNQGQNPFGFDPRTNATINLIRPPSDPLSGNATFFVNHAASFANTGAGVRWIPFDAVLAGSTDQHRAVAMRDPVTGRTRLIFGDDQGVYTGLDRGDGTLSFGIGTAAQPTGSRNGNLQITQFYYGAAQPSSAAAQVTQALFYGSAQDNGGAASRGDVLQTGNIVWGGDEGDASGVATDQQGAGTLFQYWWPCCGGRITDFFQVNGAGQIGGVGRTEGLIQASGTGNVPDPQWPFLGGFNFAVNPINSSQIVISSAVGRIFRTETQGSRWLEIGNPAVFGNSHAEALAFGAPDPRLTGTSLDNFIYAGTQAGRVFVTFTGGGGAGGPGNNWSDITNGALAGNTAPIRAIIANPTQGSHEAYAVTANRIYHIADANPAAGQAWRDITGNIFAVANLPFDNAALGPDPVARLGSLTAIAADWRYVIPDSVATPPAVPGDPNFTHPALYVGGQAGVFRSLDDGATWTLFPDRAFGAPRDGGYLPNADVRDLDLSLGNVNPNPAIARPEARPGDPNVLVATTYGRGTFAIRLAPIVFANTPTQPGILALDPSVRLGGNDRITTNPAPIVVGLSEQSAFGNTVRVDLYDLVADPNRANPIGTGQTDANGNFRIAVTRPFATPGLKAIGVQATDQSGTKGNVAPLTIFVGTAYTVDLAPESDAGRPRPPRDADDLTNVARPTFRGTAVGGNRLDPGATVTLYVNGVPAGTATVDAAGAYQVAATVDLAPGANAIAIQESVTLADGTVAVGPVSPPLTVVLDTASPGPIAPALRPADDTATPGDNITGNNMPTFEGNDAEPGAVVQLFAQPIDAQGNPTGPVFLVGEGQAESTPLPGSITARYAVRVGDVIRDAAQPVPPPPRNLADGRYRFTALQIDAAGNPGRQQAFGRSGAVIIDGTDANDHGAYDPATGRNVEGWAYMQEALENIAPNVGNGNKLVVALGATPTLSDGFVGGFFSFGNAGGSIRRALSESSLPGQGWSLVHVTNTFQGPTTINDFLGGRPVTGQVYDLLPGPDGVLGTADDTFSTTLRSVPGVRLSDAGILYISTVNQASGDLSDQDLAVVNAHGRDIATFVNAGGGLFAQGESADPGSTVQPFGWLAVVFPAIRVIDLGGGGTGPNAVVIEPAGRLGFPNLTVADLSTGPWHDYFGGLPGADGIVGTPDDDLSPLAVAVTDLDRFPSSPNAIRRNLILTSAGGQVAQNLVVTIDTTLPATPLGLDLVDASDSFFTATDAAGAHTVGSPTDNYTNVTSPSFTVGAIEAGAVVVLYRGVPGTVPVAVATATAPAGGGTLTLTDPGPVAAGTYIYQVAQSDPAGNPSVFSVPLTVRFDTSPPALPAAPRLRTDDDTGTPGDNVTNLAQPRLTGTVALTPGEAPPRVQLVEADGTILGEADAATDGTYTVTLVAAVPPGAARALTLRARAVDPAGNRNEFSGAFGLTIDRRTPGGLTAPTLTLSPLSDSGLPGDNVTRLRQPTLLGAVNRVGTTASPNPSVQLLRVLPTGLVALGAPVATAADGSYSITVPAALADGVYPLRARAFDAAGNESFSGILTLVIDNLAPTVAPGLALAPAADTGAKGDGRTSTRRPVLVGSLGGAPEPGMRLDIVDAAGTVLNAAPAVTTLRPDGTFATQLASDLVNGTITLFARGRDAADNAGPNGPPLTLTIFTTDSDYDADGAADLVTYLRANPATPGIAQWAISRSSRGLQLVPFGDTNDTPLRGDFDGDGINDVAVFRFATATWFIQGSRGGLTVLQYGPGGASQPVPADYDGDGRADIAVYIEATAPGTVSTWAVRSSRTGQTQFLPFGGPGYRPVPADYDADGFTDIAVYLPGTPTGVSQWFVLGSRMGLAQVPFGGAGYVPVPADYDGDGAADVAVYLPGTPTGVAQWFISGSRGGIRQVPFGGAGHVPVPQDYNNDGQADLAVHEPSTARWFFLMSPNATLVSLQYGVPGSVPVPAPLPYRLAGTAFSATAVTSTAAVGAGAAAAAPTIRAAAADPAPATPTTTTPTTTPTTTSGRSLDLGRQAARLASGASRRRVATVAAPADTGAARRAGRLGRLGRLRAARHAAAAPVDAVAAALEVLGPARLLRRPPGAEA